jgi:Glycosyl hydrolases family 2, TIM barrel domain
LGTRAGRRQALSTLERTVLGARSHPSVLAHSVANELSARPDDSPGTGRYLVDAERLARRADPTVPIAVDILAVPGVPQQSTYRRFDLLGINQYFGWYGPVDDLQGLRPYLAELRRLYPILMTEFGAEARPELADGPPDLKGSYAFQVGHVERTLDAADLSPGLSGVIYWTLREFEIFPGWEGGAGPRPPMYQPNTRHFKGLISYEGARKPAFWALRHRYQRMPLYP